MSNNCQGCPQAHRGYCGHVIIADAPPTEVKPAVSGGAIANPEESVLGRKVRALRVFSVVEESRPLHPPHVIHLDEGGYRFTRVLEYLTP